MFIKESHNLFYLKALSVFWERFLNFSNLVLFGLILFWLTGCNPVEITDIPTLTVEPQLNPYLTLTPSPNPAKDSAQQPPTQVSTEVPLPTPTPFVYTVIENDTLTGIAVRHSVPLEDLITANPGLDPNFLTIGLTLTIPIEGVVASILPTPTPIAIDLGDPQCYPVNDQVQCIVRVDNTQPDSIENLSVQIYLQSPDGEIIATQSTVPPLNLIPSGRSVATFAVFELPTAQKFTPQASLLTVIPVEQDTQRYLTTDLQINETLYSPDKLNVEMKGSLQIFGDEPESAIVWIVAFAYDENDNIVGYRKWVAENLVGAGDRLEYKLVVYSLGPAISRVEVIAEARPE